MLSTIESSPTNTSIAASLKNVVKDYPHQRVLHGVSLEVPQGKTLLVSGPSASGKSTSIRMLAGVETPSSGTVHLFGRSFSRMNEHDREAMVAQRVSYVQQRPSLKEGLTVFENIYLTADSLRRFSLRRNPKHRELMDRAGELALGFRISHLLERQADDTLSGGEKAKVMIARALVKSPDLLILDETTKSVDEQGTEEIYATLQQYQKSEGTTIVMVSHQLDLARSVSDHEVVIRAGRVETEHPLPLGPVPLSA